ncbi:MAG TPA: helix-turn-helix transcriptional regulator [Candidatus Limnocylindria bacterium]|nr:helix-turn-helix transcriptional regulator [Candidatus Limnocylindria bacterium]
MATRTNPIHEADRLTRWQLAEIGRELRVARVTGGRTQRRIARSVGTSVARISLLERGLVTTVTVRQLGRVAAATGLKLYLRAYPAGRRLLDAPQLALLAELRGRANSAWDWETEVPMPIAGDLRAADARATLASCSIVVELWTRLADWQAQSRAALLKQRDLRADHLLVVLRNTRANRDALRQAGPSALSSFTIAPRAFLRAMAEGRDPGGNGVVLL